MVRRSLIVRWFLAICYVVVIFLFSAQPESGAGAMRQSLLHWFPFLRNLDVQTIIFVARKSGHVLAYLLVSILFYYAAKATGPLSRTPIRFSCIAAFLVAFLDELYQGVLPHRTGSAWDVLIDSLGIAAAGLWLHRRGASRKTAGSSEDG